MNVILVTLFSTLLMQLGFFLWKLSANTQARLEAAGGRSGIISQILNLKWILGFVSLVLGWILFIKATSLGDISFVQPLISGGDFLLVLMAVVFLKERLSLSEFCGVFVAIFGAIVLSWNVESSGAAAFEVARLVNLSILTIAGVVLLSLLSLKTNWFRPEALLPLIIGLCFGFGAVVTKALTLDISREAQNSNSMLLILSNPLLLAVILANFIGLGLLQFAFRKGRASVIIPLQLATSNAYTALVAVTIFAENMSVQRSFGIALIIFSAALLKLKPASTSPAV